MTELARRILAVFAVSYPTSASFKGGRKLRKGEWHEIFPRIMTDVSAKTDFLDAVEELERAGILSVKWKRFREGDDLEALYLESPQALFDSLGLPSPESISDGMRQVLDSPEWKALRLQGLAEYLAPRLDAGHPVPVRDAAELEDLGRLFAVPGRSSIGPYPRAQRTAVRGQQAPGEAHRGRGSSVPGNGTRADLFHARTRAVLPEVSFALQGRLFLRGHDSPWSCAGEIVTFPTVTVSHVHKLELAPRGMTPEPAAVLSVENKETFRVLAERRASGLPSGIACIVYSAGHPNDAVTAFLRICVEAGASIYHYGDLDPDGILIAQEIAAALAMKVVPWNMSGELHRRYAAYGYALDSTQTARLALVSENAPAGELAKEIGRTGIGVEQEIIDVGTGCEEA